MALDLLCKTSLYFKLDLSDNAPLLNYYSPSVLTTPAGSLLTDQRCSTSLTVQTPHEKAISSTSPNKAAKPSAGSAPTAALCPPLLTTTARPGSGSRIQALSLGCCYPWRGDNAPSEAARCWLILGSSWFSLRSSWTNRVLSKQASEFSFCIAHRTAQNGVLCWKMWCGGKTSLQCYSQPLSIVISDGVSGIPLERKSCFPLARQARFLRWMTLSCMVSWKLIAFQEL